MIKAILFDIGEVVVYENFISFFEEIEEKYDLPPKTLYQAILHTKAWDKYNKGMITEDELMEIIIKEQNDDREIFSYIKNNWRKIISPIPEILELIKKLKNNYKVYALSNVDKDTVAYIQERWKIYDIFDGRVLSCEVGMMKPEKEIFELTLKRAGLEKDEVIFIDNYGKNVEAANDLGIKSIKFETYEQLLNDLKNLDIKFK